MQVRRANFAGACYGVNRALKMVEQALIDGHDAKTVHTLGPLIHNPSVVEGLAARGVEPVDSVDQVEQGTLVIRSHGVPPQVIEAAQAKSLTLVDATCPHVTRAQQAARRLRDNGYMVLVVGKLGHPEVEGIRAYAGAEALVISQPDDLPADLPNKGIGIVVQTTQTSQALKAIVDALAERGISPEVHDTICDATRQRQEAARELAQQADVMLVVGGRNSGNTTRLAEICLAACPRTYHIEGPNELSYNWFAGAEVIGITAGASTPEDQIEAVEQRLAQLDPNPQV